MRIQLLDTVQVPDEAFEGDGTAPTATNYKGAVLTVDEAFGRRCIAAGKAVECVDEASQDADETPAFASDFDRNEG